MTVIFLFLPFQAAFAAPQDDIIRRQQERIIQEEQRQQRLQQQNLPQRTQKPISTDELQQKTNKGLILDETPCFNIQQIQLVDENGEISKTAKKFNFALRYAKRKSGFKSGMCLGEQSISQIITLTQNKIIDKGYTTTQVGLTPQDLSSGSLNITVVAGRVGDIKYKNCHSSVILSRSPEQSEGDSEKSQYQNKDSSPTVQNDGNYHSGSLNNAQTTPYGVAVGKDTHPTQVLNIGCAGFNNKIPLSRGKIFNLRDLETGLENLQRTPSVNADIQIAPSEVANASDIVVDYEQGFPIRISLNVDDSGSRSTGKYQGGGAISLDNPLGLSDLFFVSYNQSFGGKKDKYIDDTGEETNSRTASYALHYSVPFYSWTFGVNHNFYRYHQAVAGYSENYDYNGESKTLDFYLSKNLYRDSRRKTDATVKLWQRQSKNFVEDAEIEVQGRRTAGWAFDLNHREYIKNAVLNLGAGYKQGTGIMDSQRPVEEEFDEGTGRMRIWTADISAYIPFSIKNQRFGIESSIHGQYNKTPLLTTDKISIGGRNTVRGFDGETTLTAEKGFYWRNDLSYAYLPSHQVYVGYDYGRVSGESKEYLLGQSLSGAAVGVKGSFKIGGNLNYDLFAAKPIVKPQDYPTHKTAFGLSLNYAF
ncbi:MAG: ShlB/FhaC/HecB family hemolysin secretion/activation protein [Neisseriaceae bacterium]|nr:ShlB/FhaC/HecB family hemolysin secretion/activation protein [Neisseriaceae bacterium]